MISDSRVRVAKPLWDFGDARFVNFTLPISQTKFVEDDLWDLAMEFPDGGEPEREWWLRFLFLLSVSVDVVCCAGYLEHVQYPRVLTFEEYVAGGY